MDYLIATLITGAGAAAVMDLWGIAHKSLFGIAPPNYGLVGRWLAHMRHGNFHHKSIAASAPVQGERIIGWVAHYLIGVAFAAVLIGVGGRSWVERPTIVPALIVGICTVSAPFLLMQPGMGMGLAASRTPHPGAARLQSFLNHAVFGLGLYVAGWTAHFLSFTKGASISYY